MTDRDYSHEELKEFIQAGGMLRPDTKGLREAARELVRPRVQTMQGREIIYHCRMKWLTLVEELTVTDEGFQAHAVPLLPVPFLGIPNGSDSEYIPKPFTFGGGWEWFRLCGASIQMNMVTDHFYPEASLVKSVKRAMLRQAAPIEIERLLEG